MAAHTLPSKETILDYLADVKDPEIPVLDVVAMGIVRDVELDHQSTLISITPTYSGCPAMEVIASEIETRLNRENLPGVKIKTVYAPPWTTDWMTAEARAKLKAFGIAPPGRQTCGSKPWATQQEHGTCPFCDSNHTELRSMFGSTACKALYYCQACQQPFEQFKCI